MAHLHDLPSARTREYLEDSGDDLIVHLELTNVVRLGRDETYEHLDDHGDELLLIKNYGSPP